MYTVYSYGDALPIASTIQSESGISATVYTRLASSNASSSRSSQTISTETGGGYGAVTESSSMNAAGVSVLNQTEEGNASNGSTSFENSQGFYSQIINESNTFMSIYSANASFSGTGSYQSGYTYSKRTEVSSGSNDDYSWAAYTGQTRKSATFSSSMKSVGQTSVYSTTLHSYVFGLTQSMGNWNTFSYRTSYSTRSSITSSSYESQMASAESGWSTFLTWTRSNITASLVAVTTSTSSSSRRTINTSSSSSQSNELTAGTSRNLGTQSSGTYSENGLQNGTYFTNIFTSEDTDSNIIRYSTTSSSTTSYASSTFINTVSTMAGKTISSTLVETYSTSSISIEGIFPITYYSSSVAKFNIYEGLGEVLPYKPNIISAYLFQNPCDNLKIGEFKDFSYLSTYNSGTTSTSSKRIKTYSFGSTGTVQSTFVSSTSTLTKTQTTSSTLFSTSMISQTVGASTMSSTVWFMQSDLDTNVMMSGVFIAPYIFPCSSLKDMGSSILSYRDSVSEIDSSTGDSTNIETETSHSSSSILSDSLTVSENYKSQVILNNAFSASYLDSSYAYVEPTVFVGRAGACAVWDAPVSLGTFNSFS